jgi:hypothetical protein
LRRGGKEESGCGGLSFPPKQFSPRVAGWKSSRGNRIQARLDEVAAMGAAVVAQETAKAVGGNASFE